MWIKMSGSKAVRTDRHRQKMLYTSKHAGVSIY